jgi:hypothetical protein
MPFLLLVALLFAGLSAEAEAVIAPVTEAIEAVRVRHGALPPPTSDSERLIRMGELDQAGRRVIVAIDFSSIPEPERQAAMDAAAAPIEAVDAENQAALLAMIPPEGWFLKSRYGAKAAEAAFHIVQHSDVTLWRRFLPVLEPLVASGEIDGQSYAMMFDRLAISEARPQRFGTQWRCDGGKYRPYPIENADRLDERRSAMGIPVTFAWEKAYYAKEPYCFQTRSAPPPGMNVTD